MLALFTSSHELFVLVSEHQSAIFSKMRVSALKYSKESVLNNWVKEGNVFKLEVLISEILLLGSGNKKSFPVPVPGILGP